MKNKYIILGIILFIIQCSTNKLVAQVVVLQVSTNVSELSLSECGLADTLTAFIRVASGSLTSPVILSDTLPINFSFEGIISGGVIASATGLGSNVAVMNLNAAVLNNVGSGGVYIRYLVRAKCAANSLTSASHQLYLTAGGGYSLLQTGKDLVSGIKAPALIVESRNNVNQPTADLGDTFTRMWRVRNTGTNSQADTIWFRIVNQAGLTHTNITVDGVSVTPTLTNGDTIWYQIIKTLRDQSVFSGDTVFITERYTVDACPPTGTNTEINAYIECYNSPFCINNGAFSSVQVPISVPQVSGGGYSVGWSCPGVDIDTFVHFITAANGTASALRVTFLQHYGNSVHTSAWFDTSSLELKLNSSGVYQKISPDSTQALSTAYNTGSIFYWEYNYPGVLNPGDTLFFIYIQRKFGNNGKNCGHINQVGHRVIADYKNNCGTTNYNNAAGGSLNGSFNSSSAGPSGKGPSDVNPGDTLTLNWISGGGRISFSNNQAYSANGSQFVYQVEYPPGFYPLADISLFNLIRSQGSSGQFPDRFADSFTIDPINRILSIYYPVNSSTSYPYNYYFNPKFVLDCSLPGATTGPVEFTASSYYRFRKNGCSNFIDQKNRWCPNTITTISHCPISGGCIRGGFLGTGASIERTNFGLPDNDGDGLPDGTGVIDRAKIALNKVVRGDTFETAVWGKILRGTNSPTSFTHGYGEITFLHGNRNLNEITMVPNSISIFMLDFSTNMSYTISGALSSTSNSGDMRTFLIDFSPSSSTGYPAGYIFDHNDSFYITADFIFEADFGQRYTNTYKDLTSPNFYISPYALPINDTAKYSCDHYSAYLNQVSSSYGNGYPGPIFSHSGCDGIEINYVPILSVSDGDPIAFPYEYRPLGFPDTLTCISYKGYILDSSKVFYTRKSTLPSTNLSQSVSITPISTYTNGSIDIASIYKVGDIFDINGGSVPLGSEGWTLTLRQYLRPSCSVINNLPRGRRYYARFEGVNSWESMNSNRINTTNATSDSRAITGHDSIVTGHTYQYDGPILSLSNFGATTIQASSNTAEWDINIQNTSIGSDGENVWLGFNSPNNNITVDSVKVLPSLGNNLTQIGGIYQLGNVPKNGGARQFRIYASYTTCDLDSLTVYSSFDCNPPGYPVHIDSAACTPNSTKVFIDPQTPLIQTDIISAPSGAVNLCDTLEWIISISQRLQASAYNVTLDVDIPNNGGKLVSTYGYKYPYTASTFSDISPVDLGGGKYRFYLSDSITSLAKSGLEPIGNGPNNEIYVKTRLITNCDFPSGANIRFTANAKKACGEDLTPDTDFSAITIVGSPTKKQQDVSMNLSPDTMRGCGKNLAINMRLDNLELNTTTAGDQIRVTLVDGSKYVPNTTFIRNSFTATEPRIDTVGLLQRLTWDVGTAIPSYDSALWVFNITNSTTFGCEGNVEIIVEALSTFTASCATVSGGTCTSTILNEEETKSFEITKPNIIIPLFTGVFMNFGPDYTYSLDATLTNLSSGDTLRNGEIIKIEYYRDENNDGIFDVGDLKLGEKSFNYGLNPGQSKNYWASISNPTAPDPNKPIFAVIDSRTSPNCICNVQSMSPFATGLPVNLLDFKASLQSKDRVLLSWSTATEINNEKFEVYRKFEGQEEFVKIGEVKGAGNSNSLMKYSFLDSIKHTFFKTAFYTLRQIDFNGDYDQSKIEVVDLHQLEKNDIVLYPNPVKTELKVSIFSKFDAFEYQITNLLGENLLEGKINKGDSINVQKLNVGLYFILLKKEGIAIFSSKFSIQ